MNALLPASQIVWQLVAWPLVVLLVAVPLRRRTPVRALGPHLALAVLLGATAAATFSDVEALDAAWFGAFPLLLATFPDGRFVPRWSVLPVLVSIGLALAYVFTAGAVSDQPWWGPWVGPLQLALLGGQVHRYLRRSSTAERESVRWAILGVVVCVELFGVLAILEGGQIATSGPWAQGAANLAVLPACLGFAVGLLRPRWTAVDAALALVVATSLAGAVLAAVFAGATTAAGALGAGASAAGWWGALAVAVAAVPVLPAARLAAGRLIHGGRAAPADAVAELGRRLDAQPDARRVPRTVLETVVASLRVDGAALVSAGGLDEIVGRVDGNVEEVPVVYQGETLGSLLVPARPGETRLTARDLDVVHVLALHCGPALHGARALVDLTDAHRRVVEAREEERRRLRRDLHDDLSPSLAGLSLGAAAVALRAAKAAPDLAHDAAQLHADVRSTMAQTREIAYGLRPEVLDDAGLVAALRTRLHGQHDDGLDVRIVGPLDRLDLPASVDVAALRIAQEAVSNVRRHAGATTCTVTVELAAHDLWVTVTDDGVGLPGRLVPGIGLTSMRERATELGGEVRLAAAPEGGSRVEVRLPLQAGGPT